MQHGGGEQGGGPGALGHPPPPQLSWAARWLLGYSPVPGQLEAREGSGGWGGGEQGVGAGVLGPACPSPSGLPAGSEGTENQVGASDPSGQADLMDPKHESPGCLQPPQVGVLGAQGSSKGPRAPLCPTPPQPPGPVEPQKE